MKIFYISDIRLEYTQPSYSEFDNHEAYDVAVLAGNIGNPFVPVYYQFLLHMKEQYSTVIVVAGIYEYLYRDVEDVNYQLSKICMAAQCVFLNQSICRVNGFTFLGCAFWSKIKLDVYYQKFWNKFTVNLGGLDPAQINLLHDKDKYWINKQIKEMKNERFIIVTGYSPSFLMLDDISFNNDMRMFHCTDYTSFIKNNRIDAWICGNTGSTPKLFIYHYTIMASNGYDFDCQGVIDIR